MNAKMNATLNTATSRKRIAWRAAYTTALTPFGSMLLGFGLAIAFSNLPMHFPEQTMNLISLLVLLAFLFAGGALWARLMAGLVESDQKRGLTWSGALSFAPSLILAGIALGRLEFIIVERGGGPDLPVHVVFTLLFVPAAFFVAWMGGVAIGIALKDLKLAVRLALGSGLAAAAAFLAELAMADSADVGAGRGGGRKAPSCRPSVSSPGLGSRTRSSSSGRRCSIASSCPSSGDSASVAAGSCSRSSASSRASWR